MKKVLVIAAHPDDETLGCGGSMLAHARAGDEVSVLLMTDGVGARGSGDGTEGKEREKALASAMQILEVSAYRQLEFPDNGMDRIPLLDVAKAIEGYVAEVGEPDVVYTHHPGDLNIDHQLTHRAAMTCFRPQGDGPNEILLFEVPSSTGWYGGEQVQFQPTCFLDISATLDGKLKALEAYAEELRPWPHVRSLQAVEHLARWRGALVGLEAGEAFVVERLVRRGTG